MFFAWEIKIHHSITSRNFRELKIKVLNIPEGFKLLITIVHALRLTVGGRTQWTSL